MPHYYLGASEAGQYLLILERFLSVHSNSFFRFEECKVKGNEEALYRANSLADCRSKAPKFIAESEKAGSGVCGFSKARKAMLEGSRGIVKGECKEALCKTRRFEKYRRKTAIFTAESQWIRNDA